MKRMIAVLLVFGMSAVPSNAQVKRAKLAPVLAETLTPVVVQARAAFGVRQPVILVRGLTDQCGGDKRTNALIRLCYSERQILVSVDRVANLQPAAAAYLLAHQFAHAAKIRHGLADIAFARIAANRTDAQRLRGQVTRLVECAAGVLHKRSYPNLDQSLIDWFGSEPFADPHWGASPLWRGPKISIGLKERDRWFRIGHRAAEFSVCAQPDFSADLLVKADLSE